MTILSRPIRLARAYGALALACKTALLALPVMAEDTFRLVAIGDSLTAGYGLPQNEGFVPQLDAWLAQNGQPDVVVVNMGVSGDTTAGGRARLDWALADGADAVFLELGANDLLRGFEPSASRENLDAMLTELGERDLPVLMSGMPAPLNYGPDYKAEFDAIWPELTEKHGVMLDPFFLEGLDAGGRYFQSDGLHPNREGVAKIVERIGPDILKLIETAKARETR